VEGQHEPAMFISVFCTTTTTTSTTLHYLGPPAQSHRLKIDDNKNLNDYYLTLAHTHSHNTNGHKAAAAAVAASDASQARQIDKSFLH